MVLWPANNEPNDNSANAKIYKVGLGAVLVSKGEPLMGGDSLKSDAQG